jgi:hypothetical protein
MKASSLANATAGWSNSDLVLSLMVCTSLL